jgi:hypothetical protein
VGIAAIPIKEERGANVLLEGSIHLYPLLKTVLQIKKDIGVRGSETTPVQRQSG